MLVVEQLKPKRHNRDGFKCGEPTLDAYLRQQAAQHHRDGISTTHVLVDDADPTRILGYYSLYAAQLLLTDLQEVDRKRLPTYPVPAIRMGRLAVSASEQGKGHGNYLLAHAVARSLGLREQLGVRMLLVDALHEDAARFYRAYGFREATANSHTLYLPLGNA
ncbi:GNAT family N-acetyltransferase [Xanthomonas translucens]|uniref:GNAT family N-acetyltransferase n=1 Tax=Xanthomonas campestris pv. translucens TaxID=343 RepID=UPI0002A79156|nr:GNAT family N-acetyltransferase [Xanthomonas translucens]ELQ10840.1 N-acetyltransferase GCN5 [Xanthomonas translucens DAR61454]MBC3973871.1 GNAT family N-acetyltransferase [Xanthomonas translucens pv. undulosa]MCT8282666.1 GNAT family N-acetyltransferase [Xanthomonas translucens pv. undulosa]MCT8317375.1 GNAT family N-acetyltransferase [Xanthomonas translucens pv. undulosa]QEN94149.1 GNAT family N-acetyltransferase [Xanthomonas translucens pv. undulosa]